MSAEELVTLYDAWQKAKDAFEDGNEFLDVENSPGERGQFEMLIEARAKAYNNFNKVYQNAAREEIQAFRAVLMARRKK